MGSRELGRHLGQRQRTVFPRWLWCLQLRGQAGPKVHRVRPLWGKNKMQVSCKESLNKTDQSQYTQVFTCMRILSESVQWI